MLFFKLFVGIFLVLFADGFYDRIRVLEADYVSKSIMSFFFVILMIVILLALNYTFKNIEKNLNNKKKVQHEQGQKRRINK